MKFGTHTYLDNLQNLIEFQGYRSKVRVAWFLVFFCVHVAAATGGQYLALSKADDLVSYQFVDLVSARTTIYSTFVFAWMTFASLSVVVHELLLMDIKDHRAFKRVNCRYIDEVSVTVLRYKAAATGEWQDSHYADTPTHGTMQTDIASMHLNRFMFNQQRIRSGYAFFRSFAVIWYSETSTNWRL